MVLGSEDIIEFYGKSAKNIFENAIELSFDEQTIYDVLVGNEMHIDEIAEKSQIDIKILLTLLMRMEIKGIITKMPGNMYMITKNR